MSKRFCRCGAIVQHAMHCTNCGPVSKPEKTDARGYDWQWRKVRLRVLAEEPCCVDCEKDGVVQPAEHVHHIVPINVDRSLRLERSNLVPLCVECHEKRHKGPVW